jgi:hypothetical protein
VGNPKERNKITLTQVPKIFGCRPRRSCRCTALGDMFVPFSMETAYAKDVARFHMGFNVVQRAVRTVNHCEFSNTEVGAAWDDLVNWVTHRVRPAGDAVSDRMRSRHPTSAAVQRSAGAYATERGRCSSLAPDGGRSPSHGGDPSGSDEVVKS